MIGRAARLALADLDGAQAVRGMVCGARQRRVAVTDGHQRAALAAVRSLGRAGYGVVVVAHKPGSLAAASRWCSADVVLPRPQESGEYVDGLARMIERLRIDVLLPIADASLIPVLAARDRLPPVAIPFPEYAVFERARDKEAVLAVAQQVGIAIPWQRVVESPDQWRHLHEDELTFPLVVKPSRSVPLSGSGTEGLAVTYASDRGTLAAIGERVGAHHYPVLVQEQVRGSGVGVFLLLWQGRQVARFCHRRLREKPPWGGVSVLSESVPVDAELVGRSQALLTALGWEGAAMVEYKREAETGRPVLMEVNGRLWGSLQLAVDAGVDFPRLLIGSVLGDEVEPVKGYQVGVRSHWFWGDVDQCIIQVRETLRGAGRGGVLWPLAQVIHSALSPRCRGDVFSLADPGPFLTESAGWISAAGRGPGRTRS